MSNTRNARQARAAHRLAVNTDFPEELSYKGERILLADIPAVLLMLNPLSGEYEEFDYDIKSKGTEIPYPYKELRIEIDCLRWDSGVPGTIPTTIHASMSGLSLRVTTSNKNDLRYEKGAAIKFSQ